MERDRSSEVSPCGLRRGEETEGPQRRFGFTSDGENDLVRDLFVDDGQDDGPEANTSVK